MAKRIIIQQEEPEELQRSRFHKSVQVSDTVRHVAPAALTLNPLNKELFSSQEGKEYEKLKSDIGERGIVVPLIAKHDGTLLAGHTRLRIAKELRLKSVPVQYVNDLSADEERKFLVNDNLLRRHLTNTERIQLYRFLYPDFDSTFLNEETRIAQGRMNKGSERLTISTIAQDTNQEYDTVKRQIQRAKTEKQQQQQKGNVVPFSQKPRTTLVKAQTLVNKLRATSTTMTAKERKELRGLLEHLLSTL